jgi:two-component system, OmpR family, alkaline phosphatase synthesis response regulator PhoP
VTSPSPDRSTGAERPSARRILIADDAVSSRELLRTILERQGYVVMEAVDGAQAVDEAPNFAPHLIILDLQMPKLDGYSTAIALRKILAFASTPIIALAAALPEVSAEQMSEAGFTQCLVKPISPTRLRECVTELLWSPQTPQMLTELP